MFTFISKLVCYNSSSVSLCSYLKAKKTLTGITFLGPSNPAIQGNKDWKVVKQHDVVPPAQE